MARNEEKEGIYEKGDYENKRGLFTMETTKMAEALIIPSIVRRNVETVKYIIGHPENWGSGTKESWERALKELEEKLAIGGKR